MTALKILSSSIINVHQASSVPVHNMFSEHALGLADYHYRKASNIKVGFLDGNVKCIIKGTIQWLWQHEHNILQDQQLKDSKEEQFKEENRK